MALTKNKTYVSITVDGRQFGYNVAQGEEIGRAHV